MCGIVGLISKDVRMPWHGAELFTELLRADTIRGEDSTGVFGVTKTGKIDIMKGDTNGHLFTASSNYNKFKNQIGGNYSIVIGHNRKATRGTVSPHNAHPFKEKHITLVHNGTIKNAAALNMEVDVDSHAIAHALSDHDCVTALSKIDGAYALAWFDQKDKTLNLARNAERPLFLVEYDDLWIVSSEIGLPVWLQGRENRKHLSYKLIPTKEILVFNLTDLKKGPYEVAYNEYKAWSPPVVMYPKTSYSTPNVLPLRGSLHSLAEAQAKYGIKQGDQIRFRLVDSKTETPNEILIGHPVFEDEMDENIIVRAVLPLGVDAAELIADGDLFTSRCQYLRKVGGMSVIFVTDVQPLKIITDISGKSSELLSITEAIAQGCGKCKGAIDLSDVAESIVRKRADNTWRLICKTCLTESRKQAHQPKVDLVH